MEKNNLGLQNDEVVIETTNQETKGFEQTDITVVQLIQEAVIEHAESRTERYELWKDKDKGILKTDFERACHTSAFLASKMLPNSEIVLTDKFGETRRLSPTSYSAPKELGIYEIMNFSNRVYFCDIDAENMHYITSINRPFGFDEKLVMTPEAFDSFWKNYMSCEKNTTLTSTKLTKGAVNISSLPGLTERDDNYKGGWKFNALNLNTSQCKVSQTCVEALLISAERLNGLGREQVMTSVGALVHQLATSASKVVGAGDDVDNNNNGE